MIILPYYVLLFGISGGEIFIILLLILILFGPKKIPEIARTLGKGMNEIKKVQRDINAEINKYSNEIENPAKKVKEDIEGFRKGMQEPFTSNDAEAKEQGKGAENSKPEKEVPAADELPYPYNTIDPTPDEPESDDTDDTTDHRKEN